MLPLHIHFYAIGQHDAIGTSPFAVASLTDLQDTPLAKSYTALRQVAPLILAAQGGGTMVGFLLDTDHPSLTCEIGDYRLEISLDEVFHFKADIGYCLVIAVGPDEFVGVGSGFRVIFRLKDAGGAGVGIAAVDEGEYRSGRWVPGHSAIFLRPLSHLVSGGTICCHAGSVARAA